MYTCPTDSAMQGHYHFQEKEIIEENGGKVYDNHILNKVLIENNNKLAGLEFTHTKTNETIFVPCSKSTISLGY